MLLVVDDAGAIFAEHAFNVRTQQEFVYVQETFRVSNGKFRAHVGGLEGVLGIFYKSSS